jgi:hypothetical protein
MYEFQKVSVFFNMFLNLSFSYNRKRIKYLQNRETKKSWGKAQKRWQGFLFAFLFSLLGIKYRLTKKDRQPSRCPQNVVISLYREALPFSPMEPQGHNT